jgi:hypothetical protein
VDQACLFVVLRQPMCHEEVNLYGNCAIVGLLQAGVLLINGLFLDKTHHEVTPAAPLACRGVRAFGMI